MIGIMIDLPNFLGWGNHYFDLDSLNCLWDRLASRSYVYFFVIVSICIPVLLICMFYFKIYKKVREMNSDHLRENKKLIQMTKGLFASCFIFTVCSLPYGLILLIDLENKLHRTAFMFSLLLLHLNSSLNPILYAFTNTQIREGYLNLFYFLFNRKKYIY